MRGGYVTSCVIACHGDRRDRRDTCDRCDTCDMSSDSSTDRKGNTMTCIRVSSTRLFEGANVEPESSKVTERMTTCHRCTCRGWSCDTSEVNNVVDVDLGQLAT